MKELSIEEKANCYDEAIERAKAKFSNEEVEDIFPELKESYDESIRKWLIEMVEEIRKVNPTDADHNGMCTDAFYWLEKQGEKKLTIKPKFKVGDWIVNNGDGEDVCRITHILTDLDSSDEFSYEHTEGCFHNSFEDSFHLWTIKDAKDGDVLVASDGSIFLFKGTIDGACKHYIALTTDGAVKFNEGLEHYWEASRAVHPATKEQRDTLMKAMADAGYTFDFEKKELKKIEQKPTPKYKVGDTIYYNSFGKIESMVVDNIITDSTDNPMYEDKEGNAVFEKDLIEQKPVWSEEDEFILKDAITAVDLMMSPEFQESHPNLYKSFEVAKHWLKSLKDRVQPLPKQEWSEEDKEMVQVAINACNLYQDSLVRNDSRFDKAVKAEEWLKSLRPQNRWKPSDNQIVALRWVLNNVPYNKHKEEISGLLGQIKDL